MFTDPIATELPNEMFAVKARIQRDKILNETVDRVNPIRYANLSTQQQQELADYRQALLDVPQQQGFPTLIIWPEKPSWL